MYSDDKISVRKLTSIVGLVLVLAGLIEALAQAQVGGAIPPALEVGDVRSKKKYTAYPPQ